MNKLYIKTITECGIDYNEGVEKFLGEVELYESLLVDFLTENTFDEAKKCAAKKNYQGLLRAVHAMKSVTGTLCMKRLYDRCSVVVGLLRDEKYDEAVAAFDKAYELYQHTAETIRTVF